KKHDCSWNPFDKNSCEAQAVGPVLDATIQQLQSGLERLGGLKDELVRGTQEQYHELQMTAGKLASEGIDWIRRHQEGIVNGAVVGITRAVDTAENFAEGLEKRASALGRALKTGATFKIR